MRCERSTRRVVAAMLIGLHGVVACGAPRRVPTGLAPGDVVRVTIRNDGTVRGRATALRVDTLVVESDSGRTVVLADSVARLEVRTGTHGNGGVGFLIGAVVGGAGLAGAAFAAGGSASEDDVYGPGYFAILGGFFGFLAGGALGAVFGSATRSESWARVPETAFAQGWTYAVEDPSRTEKRPDEPIAPGPVTDPSSPVTLAPRARVVRSTGAVIELIDAWVSIDSVGGSAVSGGVAISLPRVEIVRVLAPRGRRGHALLGLGLGLAAGFIGGAIVGLSESAEDGGRAGAFVGGSVGAVIGLLAGDMVTSDHWVVMDLDAVVRGQQVR